MAAAQAEVAPASLQQVVATAVAEPLASQQGAVAAEAAAVPLIACRAAVPDIQRMADMLLEEFETLKQAACVNPPTANVQVIEIGAAKRAVKMNAAGSDVQPADKIAK